jgi:signal transduction histidine kinase
MNSGLVFRFSLSALNPALCGYCVRIAGRAASGGWRRVMTEPERADGGREQNGSARATPLGLRSVARGGPSPPHIAVGEILQQILAFPDNSDAALKAVLETAMRLCAAQAAVVWITEQESMRIAAVAGSAAAVLPSAGAEVDAFDHSRQAFARGEPFVQMADGPLLDANGLGDDVVRTTIGLDGASLIGQLAAVRDTVQVFSEVEIGALQALATAAAVALETARSHEALEMTRRALEQARRQQSATAEILRVIGRTTFDLDSVMNTLTRSAADLCGADMSGLHLREGSILVGRGAAHDDPKMADFIRRTPVRVDDRSSMGRAVLFGHITNVADVDAQSGTHIRTFTNVLHHKSILVMPLMKEGRGIGVFTLGRMSVGSFSADQVELVQAFADQALIAIENFRLVEELKARTKELAASLEDLRAAQHLLVQSEKLAALGQMVAGVAHEINSPVGISLTVASAFEGKVASLSREVSAGAVRRSSFEAFLEAARSATSQLLANLIRAADLIQSFKQVAVDRSQTMTRAFDLKDVTEQVITSVRPILKNASPALSIEIGEGLVVNGNPGAYGQVLTNLLMNAVIHAFPDRRAGTIAVSAHRIEDDRITLIFMDDGIGMTPDVLRQAFDPFFTTSRGRGGTGLGLHIVHNILVQQLGWHLKLDSLPNEGTRFIITIPKEFVVEGG